MKSFNQSTIQKEIKELPYGILKILLNAAASVNINSIAIVGGIVRDLLTKSKYKDYEIIFNDLDIIIEGETTIYLKELQRILGPNKVKIIRNNTTYKTSEITINDIKIDIASARKENYPIPGENPIVKSSTILGYDLRYLSIDIFSAAIGARQVFYNEINSEYLIWKICNKNLHRLVLYNGNKLNAYIEIYRKNSKFIPKQYVGSEENKTLLINCVNEILINKSNFHRFNNIYVYQTKQNRSDINRIIDLNFKNIKILNFNKMIDQTKEYNPLKYIPFVENGIVFKGIDI